MYATILQATAHTLGSAEAHTHSGRALARDLATLPGFLAFLALDTDPTAGASLFDRQASIAAAEEVIARWQQEE